MKMLVDSQWVKASDGNWREVVNPGTGEVIDRVPVATLQDAERAVQAAQRGKKAMCGMPAHERLALRQRMRFAFVDTVHDFKVWHVDLAD